MYWIAFGEMLSAAIKEEIFARGADHEQHTVYRCTAYVPVCAPENAMWTECDNPFSTHDGRAMREAFAAEQHAAAAATAATAAAVAAIGSPMGTAGVTPQGVSSVVGGGARDADVFAASAVGSMVRSSSSVISTPSGGMSHMLERGLLSASPLARTASHGSPRRRGTDVIDHGSFSSRGNIDTPVGSGVFSAASINAPSPGQLSAHASGHVSAHGSVHGSAQRIGSVPREDGRRGSFFVRGYDSFGSGSIDDVAGEACRSSEALPCTRAAMGYVPQYDHGVGCLLTGHVMASVLRSNRVSVLEQCLVLIFSPQREVAQSLHCMVAPIVGSDRVVWLEQVVRQHIRELLFSLSKYAKFLLIFLDESQDRAMGLDLYQELVRDSECVCHVISIVDSASVRNLMLDAAIRSVFPADTAVVLSKAVHDPDVEMETYGGDNVPSRMRNSHRWKLCEGNPFLIGAVRLFLPLRPLAVMKVVGHALDNLVVMSSMAAFADEGDLNCAVSPSRDELGDDISASQQQFEDSKKQGSGADRSSSLGKTTVPFSLSRDATVAVFDDGLLSKASMASTILDYYADYERREDVIQDFSDLEDDAEFDANLNEAQRGPRVGHSKAGAPESPQSAGGDYCSLDPVTISVLVIEVVRDASIRSAINECVPFRPFIRAKGDDLDQHESSFEGDGALYGEEFMSFVQETVLRSEVWRSHIQSRYSVSIMMEQVRKIMCVRSEVHLVVHTVTSFEQAIDYVQSKPVDFVLVSACVFEWMCTNENEDEGRDLSELLVPKRGTQPNGGVVIPSLGTSVDPESHLDFDGLELSRQRLQECADRWHSVADDDAADQLLDSSGGGIGVPSPKRMSSIAQLVLNGGVARRNSPAFAGTGGVSMSGTSSAKSGANRIISTSSAGAAAATAANAAAAAMNRNDDREMSPGTLYGNTWHANVPSGSGISALDINPQVSHNPSSGSPRSPSNPADLFNGGVDRTVKQQHASKNDAAVALRRVRDRVRHGLRRDIGALVSAARKRRETLSSMDGGDGSKVDEMRDMRLVYFSLPDTSRMVMDAFFEEIVGNNLIQESLLTVFMEPSAPLFVNLMDHEFNLGYAERHVIANRSVEALAAPLMTLSDSNAVTVEDMQQRVRSVSHALEQFVPPAFLNILQSAGRDLVLGGCIQQTMTIMFLSGNSKDRVIVDGGVVGSDASTGATTNRVTSSQSGYGATAAAAAAAVPNDDVSDAGSCANGVVAGKSGGVPGTSSLGVGRGQLTVHSKTSLVDAKLANGSAVDRVSGVQHDTSHLDVVGPLGDRLKGGLEKGRVARVMSASSIPDAARESDAVSGDDASTMASTVASTRTEGGDRALAITSKGVSVEPVTNDIGNAEGVNGAAGNDDKPSSARAVSSTPLTSSMSVGTMRGGLKRVGSLRSVTSLTKSRRIHAGPSGLLPVNSASALGAAHRRSNVIIGRGTVDVKYAIDGNEIVEQDDGGIIIQREGEKAEVVDDGAMVAEDSEGIRFLTEHGSAVPFLSHPAQGFLSLVLPNLIADDAFIDKIMKDGLVLYVVARGLAAMQAYCAVERAVRVFSSVGQQIENCHIGINTGYAVLGLFGSEEHLEPSVLGDCVNLASRIHGICGYYGIRVVITGATYDHLGEKRDEFLLRLIDIVKVVGRDDIPVKLYEVVSADDPSVRDSKRSYLGVWSEMLEAFESGEMRLARTLITACDAVRSTHDSVLDLYRDRILSIMGFHESAVERPSKSTPQSILYREAARLYSLRSVSASESSESELSHEEHDEMMRAIG